MKPLILVMQRKKERTDLCTYHVSLGQVKKLMWIFYRETLLLKAETKTSSLLKMKQRQVLC